ncbi:MAG: hypothetical protein ABIT38_02460 [Gemmatimonadaceae bacterium]
MRRRPAVQQAFDEARFGGANILNVRDQLPTGAEAVRRAEGWLRTRQVERAGEVLVITGRGKGSPGQVGVVREEIHKLLMRLRRAGVVHEMREHTPGSFAITLAPLRALFDAPRRHRDASSARSVPVPDSSALTGLEAATRTLLHQLAERSLHSLGVSRPDARQVETEMARQFSLLVRGGADKERSDSWLRTVIDHALREYEDLEP